MNLCPDFLGYLKADFLQGTETSWAAAALADGRKAGGAAVVVLAGGVGISAGAAATSAGATLGPVAPVAVAEGREEVWPSSAEATALAGATRGPAQPDSAVNMV